MEDEQPPKKVEKEQEEQEELEQYDTFLYRFQQQIIDAWKPVPYTSNNVILYAVLCTSHPIQQLSASDSDLLWSSLLPPPLKSNNDTMKRVWLGVVPPHSHYLRHFLHLSTFIMDSPISIKIIDSLSRTLAQAS